MEATATGPVRVEHLADGAIWRATFGATRGNILDAAAIAALTELFAAAAAAPSLKAIVLQGEGEHFSFGASVEEHLPGQVERMLPDFHGMFRAMLDCDVPCLAAVRGRCLGGGLELASFCHRIFAAPDARLGQPEIVLGVFAPVACAFLRERVGRPAAEDLCLTGRVVGADEALAMGLVDAVADDPTDAALDWARTHLLPRSASSLRFCARALRHGIRERLLGELKELERMYLGQLMATDDALEGLRAFTDKRPPAWRDR